MKTSALPLLGLLFGPALLGCGLWSMSGAHAQRNWTTATGVILESEVVDGGGGRARSVTPSVRYEYVVNDEVYVADRIRYGLFTTERGAHEIAARFREGDTVRVLIDPRDPARAALRRGGMTTGVLMTVAGVLLTALWLRAVVHERRAGPAANAASR